ncbi:MAG: hypothetical protein JKY29_09060, partial [Gammaproteobacteria bacterium]|nr:hypothetical protein [Gammaproteobacteria bacterium]
MKTTSDWAFADSPALVLMLDNELTCRSLSRPWRERLDLPESEEPAIPASDLLDLIGRP